MVSQAENRVQGSFDKYREFEVLSEEDLEKLRNKRSWLIDYIRDKSYFTLARAAGDFMYDQWDINVAGKGKSQSSAGEIRRLLIYGLLPVVRELLKTGKIVKHNQRTYKVVK